MMIPYGYKQTEVGVIPKDWECVKIKDVATISMCKRIFANQTSTIGDVPFYKIGTFGKEADAYISSKLYVEYRNKYSFPQKGDILISAAGTLGRTVVYDGEKAYFQDSNIVWLDINKTRLCNEYLNQYYKVIKWASSEGSTIARLYNGIIYATYISLPPLPEQQRIAEALSNVDGMISSLEKLVAKYKSIKTACLQQMFPQNGETVPRMRLPGFTGAWEQRKLNELVVYISSNLTASDASEEGDCNLYDANSIIGKAKVEPIRTKYITIIKDGASVGRIRKMPENTFFIGTMGGLQAKKSDLNFVFALLTRHDIGKSFSGSTIPHIYFKDYGNNKYLVPKLTEQEVLGRFFSNLDNLITLHQRKLEKLQKIKQGMMQQLLTGKVRLK